MDPDTDTFKCERCETTTHDTDADDAHVCGWCDRMVCDSCWMHDHDICVGCYDSTFVCEVCEVRFDDDDHHSCDHCECWVCDEHYVDGPDMCTKCVSDQGVEDHSAGPYTTSPHGAIFPWEHRGIAITVEHPKHDPSPDAPHYPNWQACWPIDRTLDPVTAAADFYLLELLCHPGLHVGVGGASDPDLVVFAEMARVTRAHIIDTFDPVFCRYVDMVVGGELRHVSQVRANGLIRSPRPVAWLDWHSIRAQVGVDALNDAAKLFAPMSGSFGGEPWAQAAEIVASRLRGRITAEQFVDRVFTLEHNCGSLLNKLTWGLDASKAGANQDFFHDVVVVDGVPTSKYTPIECIKDQIGPAHASNPPILPVLMAHASARARRLFQDWYRAVNKVRVRMQVPPLPPISTFANLAEFRVAQSVLVASYIELANPVFAQVLSFGPRWLYANAGEQINWVARYRRFVRNQALRPPDYAWLIAFTNLIGARAWDDAVDGPLVHAIDRACMAIDVSDPDLAYIEGRPGWAQPSSLARAGAALEAVRVSLAERGITQHLFTPPGRRLVYQPRHHAAPPAPAVGYQPELEF